MSMKGSYFPNEHYCFDKDSDNLPVFVNMLKNRGYYIGSDNHIRSPKGTLCSKIMRNGYYMTSAAFNKKTYYFMEHRVIWCWLKGPIPDGMVVNHKDYKRANNAIDNLELMTQKENIAYSRCHMIGKYDGEKSGKAKLTDKQAQAIKTLSSVCGWTNKQIADLTGVMKNNVSRIIHNKRYPNVIATEDIMSIYPTVVDFTRNKSISKTQEVINYSLGLAGECGEVVDIVKKIVFHGKNYEPVDLILELGDVLYYLCALCNVLGIDFSEVMLNNNAKLIQRYKNGYSVQQSLNRIEDERGKLQGNGNNR